MGLKPAILSIEGKDYTSVLSILGSNNISNWFMFVKFYIQLLGFFSGLTETTEADEANFFKLLLELQETMKLSIEGLTSRSRLVCKGKLIIGRKGKRSRN